MVDPRNIEIIADDYADAIRRMPGAARLRRASELFSFARRVILHRLRVENPDWTQEQVFAEALRRLTHGSI